MDTDCVIHFKDKVLTKEKKREFTEVMLKKLLDCRKDWLSLDRERVQRVCCCCKGVIGQNSS